MRDGEVERVINACDAGREGELIFAPHPQSIPSLLDAIRRGDKTVR